MFILTDPATMLTFDTRKAQNQWMRCIQQITKIGYKLGKVTIQIQFVIVSKFGNCIKLLDWILHWHQARNVSYRSRFCEQSCTSLSIQNLFSTLLVCVSLYESLKVVNIERHVYKWSEASLLFPRHKTSPPAHSSSLSSPSSGPFPISGLTLKSHDQGEGFINSPKLFGVGVAKYLRMPRGVPSSVLC